MASSAEGDEGTVVALAGVLQSGFQELSLNKLATSLGASEQALRLIISIFLGLPSGWILLHCHRQLRYQVDNATLCSDFEADWFGC
ncbi:LPCAT3 isoform 3 [Pan troglodytes]|uniref:Lysophosphatidylcholine acyltransferase 3 n=4 Tax=Homininae TaxID=207598 RepID=F5H7K7_HUMAN|nr:lysophosphatidylcholine acyltransferase 3 [Homo sapiens]KAI4064411.1 lysophosphatidylcholine acyltransferase 3 [Homo sapiens]PNI21129.1 LPCAT3 isoform 3 [Pan troglodytes]